MRVASGRAASLRRWRGPDHPETREAERDQAAAAIADYVTRVVETFPKLTDQQIAHITALLRQTPTDAR